MNIILTNYGHKCILDLFQKHYDSNRQMSSETRMLSELLEKKKLPYGGTDLENILIDQGMVEKAPETMELEEITRRYTYNPLENVSRIVFEFTTYCNFHCLHCRSGVVKRITESDLNALKSAIDIFLRMGILRFDFIGGEISKYGDGWLELVKYIRSYANRQVILITNGWWLEQKEFKAAGKSYSTVEDYLSDLRESGVTHILFSVDGPEEIHDTWRKKPGLYRRILDGFSLVKKMGMEPRVSLVIRREENSIEKLDHLIEIADLIYSLPEDLEAEKKIQLLFDDSTNQISNFIDINNGVQLGRGQIPLSDMPEDFLHCKAMFRPAPTLRVLAGGEVSICPILNGGEIYGNIHKRDLVDILNHLQDSCVFQLHAEKKIREYLPFLDTEIFGDSFDHICTVRIILTLIAKGMKDKNISPDDRAAIRELNIEVAKETGHFKFVYQAKSKG